MVNQIENSHFLEHVETENIPHLVDFPIKKILDLYPDRWGLSNGQPARHSRGWIWDMGFGPAKKLDILRLNGFTVGGYDINELAVKSARKRRDFFGSVADVRYFGSGEAGISDSLTWLEQVEGLLYEAVFPSLLGDSWKEALDAADLMLKPGKYIFIGDFLNASRVYPELFTRKELLGERTWKESAAMWKGRYATNHEAFKDLGLSYGSFAVAAPGPRKFEIDWSQDPELLRFLYDSREKLPEGFERFARHLDRNEVVSYLTEILGYKLIQETYIPRKSRSNSPNNRWNVAPGIEWTFQKQETFKYDTWRYGLNPDDPEFTEKYKLRKGAPLRSDYYEDYYGLLLKRIPKSQRPIFSEFASLVGVSV